MFRWSACGGSADACSGSESAAGGDTCSDSGPGRAAADAGAADRAAERPDADSADHGSTVHARVWTRAYFRAVRAAADIWADIACRTDSDDASSGCIRTTRSDTDRRLVQETEELSH